MRDTRVIRRDQLARWKQLWRRDGPGWITGPRNDVSGFISGDEIILDRYIDLGNSGISPDAMC